MSSDCIECGKGSVLLVNGLCEACSDGSATSDSAAGNNNLSDTATTFNISKSKRFISNKLQETGRKKNVNYSSVNTSPVSVKISYDEDFFKRVVQNNEMKFPDSRSVDSVKFVENEIFIGRSDENRGIYPELDLLKYTKDIAVSVRHAVVRVSANGDLSITDLGSTNGTYLADPYSDAIEPHNSYEISSGEPIFLGAWTKLIFETE